MSIKKLENKNIAILGLGSENEFMIDFLLKKKIDCNISIFDSRDSRELGEKYKKYKNKENIYWNLALKKNDFTDFDIVFRSPGWPVFDEALVRAKKSNLETSSAMNLFFELCPTKNIIGVTGTKGKGTTSSLIYSIIRKSGKRVWLGGNIGIAPFSFIEKIKKNDWIVLELSSFQLEDLKYSPRIAVMTNFTKEHLAPADPQNPNYHKTFSAYWRAKANIFSNQKNNDKLILNIKLAKRIEKEEVRGERIFFYKSDLVSKMIGEHNKENIAVGVELAKILRIKKEIVDTVVKNFSGLEHRLELVRELRGVRYYNDSFATTPESSIIALRSFNNRIILLAGGADKGADFKQLAKEIRNKVAFVVLFKGLGSDKIKKELLKINFPKKNIKTVSNIKNAFLSIEKIAEENDVVLLSTACASFGVFKNYKERGRLFKEGVLGLK